MAVVRKRRRRQLSAEAEIHAKAKQIHADQMAEAMMAATLMIVGRKLDEIRALLQNVGVSQVQTPVELGANRVSNSNINQVSHSAIEHPCVQCGREGVRRTRPNRFNRQGSWYCLAHVKLGAVVDIEDKIDAGFNQGPPLADKQPQLQVVPQKSAEPVGAGSLAEAMAGAELDAEAALGVPQ